MEELEFRKEEPQNKHCSSGYEMPPSFPVLGYSSSAPQLHFRFLGTNADFPFQLQFSLEPEPIAINCTAFNHNGNLLVTGAADGIVRLFGMLELSGEVAPWCLRLAALPAEHPSPASGEAAA